MIILGIETSCDETAASVIQDGRVILSHIVASSVQMHIETGGIIPERAAREQVRSIIPVVEKALLKAMPQKSSIAASPHSIIANIDAIAVTVGPGLIGSLLVGVETARTLSYVWDKPIVPVNHLAAHIYANWLSTNPKSEILNPKQIQNLKFKIQKEPKLPAVALVVSGGHTDLVLLKDHGNMTWIGGTRDDAAGEAFDKTARILGLPYPGGPAIAAKAAKFKIKNLKFKINLPRPMIDEDNFDFSFSGLKTAVLKEVNRTKAMKLWSNKAIRQIACEIQEAITDVLVEKTLRAVKEYKVPSLFLAGGVAANQRLREKFEYTIHDTKYKIHLHIPPPRLCTDNASYIAAYAYYNYKPVPWQEISANPGLTITQI